MGSSLLKRNTVKISVIKEGYITDSPSLEGIKKRILACLADPELTNEEETLLNSFYSYITSKNVFTVKMEETLRKVESALSHKDIFSFPLLGDDHDDLPF